MIKKIDWWHKPYCIKIRKFHKDPQTAAKKREPKGKQESYEHIMGYYWKPTNNREQEL